MVYQNEGNINEFKAYMIFRLFTYKHRNRAYLTVCSYLCIFPSKRMFWQNYVIFCSIMSLLEDYTKIFLNEDVILSQYTLYLDESEIPSDNGDRYFVIGGVIISNEYHENKIVPELKQLKKKIWENDTDYASHILHELEINNVFRGDLKDAKEYNLIFKDNKEKYEQVYRGIYHILNDRNVYTIAACINHTELEKHYAKEEMNDRFAVLIQIIIENYCHFLIKHKSTGDICYESMMKSQNEKIERRFCHLKSIGTMYYSSSKVISLLKNINFVDKAANCAGLQLADFIPNALGRTQASKYPKYKNLPKIIKKRLYHGYMGRKDKYGFKIIP